MTKIFQNGKNRKNSYKIKSYTIFNFFIKFYVKLSTFIALNYSQYIYI